MYPWLQPVPRRLPALPRPRGPRGRMILLAAAGALGVVLTALATEAVVRGRLAPGTDRAALRLYARPVTLSAGTRMAPQDLTALLDRLGYVEVGDRPVTAGEYRRFRNGIMIGRRGFRHAAAVDTGGSVAVRFDGWNRITAISSADGWLDRATLEPELLALAGPHADQDRLPVPLAHVPDVLVQAVLTIEDQRFARHGGLDLARIAGAFLANVRSASITQGASTITQQLARSLYLSNTRSPVRKAREAALALALEARYSKPRILEAYLNEIYLGQDGGRAIHGVGRAAQYYFGKDVAKLDLADAALLAGMLRGPNLYHPVRNAERAKDRRDLVLRLMRERGLIDDAQLDRARRTRLPRTVHPAPRRTGRYFADYVRTQLDATDLKGAAVFTTLDAGLQRLAEDAVRSQLARLEREAPYLRRTDSPLQAALVAVDPRTGEILAMVGGRDYGTTQFNRAVAGRRQPGSAFKPVVALAALSRRDGTPRFTLASMLEDAPLSVETPAGRWEPVNYDGQFRGPITLRAALERSLNVPFARLGLAVGPERIVETARTLGIRSPLRPYPAIALGAFEVTPLEMAQAFGVFAAGGWQATPHAVLGVLDERGRFTQRAEAGGRYVVDAAEAYLVTSALVGAVERGTGRALQQYGYWGAVAAKSGTSSDFRDGWFIGYTPTLAVAVWVGFDDGRSLGLPGSRAALPIFARFLSEGADADTVGAFPMPYGIEIVAVDPATGLRADWGCYGEAEVFLRGTAPSETCERDRWRWSSSGYVNELRRRVAPLVDRYGRELARVLRGRQR